MLPWEELASPFFPAARTALRTVTTQYGISFFVLASFFSVSTAQLAFAAIFLRDSFFFPQAFSFEKSTGPYMIPCATESLFFFPVLTAWVRPQPRLRCRLFAGPFPSPFFSSRIHRAVEDHFGSASACRAKTSSCFSWRADFSRTMEPFQSSGQFGESSLAKWSSSSSPIRRHCVPSL